LQVIEVGTAMSEGERAKSVEVKEVRAFEVAGATEEARSRYIPEVDRPQAEREDKAVGAETLGG
jgi:hypothetical protein